MLTWDPVEWATKLQQAKFDKWQNELQLKMANETYKEFFIS